MFGGLFVACGGAIWSPSPLSSPLGGGMDILPILQRLGDAFGF